MSKHVITQMNEALSNPVDADRMLNDKQSDVSRLCSHNIDLLKQMACVIDLLQRQATPAFNYAQAIGPHLRHVIEHYAALFNTLTRQGQCIDYDVRERNLAIQNVPAITLAKTQELIDQFEVLAAQKTCQPDQPLQTRLRSGSAGECEFIVNTSLARELLFLASHAVHHFALIRHYCKDAGLELGHDFGKAPATIAFERGQR